MALQLRAQRGGLRSSAAVEPPLEFGHKMKDFG
jgi:hypothetical protein